MLQRIFRYLVNLVTYLSWFTGKILFYVISKSNLALNVCFVEFRSCSVPFVKKIQINSTIIQMRKSYNTLYYISLFFLPSCRDTKARFPLMIYPNQVWHQVCVLFNGFVPARVSVAGDHLMGYIYGKVQECSLVLNHPYVW